MEPDEVNHLLDICQKTLWLCAVLKVQITDGNAYEFWAEFFYGLLQILEITVPAALAVQLTDCVTVGSE